MFDKEQLVKLKWNNTNRKWFESKGYVYTKRYDEFYVKAYELKDKSDVSVFATCDYCGKIYETRYFIIKQCMDKNEKNSCAHCASRKKSEKTRNYRISKHYDGFLKECERRGYEPITTAEEIEGIKSYVLVDTPSGIQRIMLDNFLHGHDCFNESYKNRNYKRIPIKEIKNTIENDGNLWLNDNEYTNCVDRCLIIKCKCGNTFKTSYVNYVKANVRRCSKCVCAESSGEKEVRESLEQLGIEYEPEKRFDDCRDKKPLPFDFYLKDYNLIIEFDGKQHYEPIFDNYELTIKHDAIKNKYCKDKGINILRIPYWDGHKTKEIISNKISSLKI